MHQEVTDAILIKECLIIKGEEMVKTFHAHESIGIYIIDVVPCKTFVLGRESANSD